MRVTIKVIRDNQEIDSKVFETGVYRFGRSDFSDLVLEDESVSRSHVEVRVTESAVYVTSMAPAGRVRLNGEVIETGEIKDGDEIAMGPFKVVVYLGELPADNAASEQPALEGDPFAVASAPQEPLQEGGAEAPPEAPAEDVQGQVIDFPSPEPAPALLGGSDYPVEGTAALQRSETIVEMKPVAAKLLFTDGPRNGDEILVEAYEVTFGRSKRADVFLDDEKLSRLHAKITRVGMGFRLIDLNSRNGTFVNGVRVLEHPLNSFDVIELGNTKMKFLIADALMGELNRKTGNTNVVPIESTKSLQFDPAQDVALVQLEKPMAAVGASQPPAKVFPLGLAGRFPGKKAPNRKLLYGAVVGLLVVFFLLPSGEDKGKETAPTASANKPIPVVGESSKEASEPKAPSALPKEYGDLSPEVQRQIEGNYNQAIRSAEKEQYEKGVAYLRKIHELIPYYKQSRDLMEQYQKRVREREVIEAQERAKREDKQDLNIYLEEGLEYLKQGKFAEAGEAFHSAINIDPNNLIAQKGLKAVEYKVTDIDKVPAEKNPNEERKKQVADLFEKAVTAFYNKSYQEAIDTAEKIRGIEVKGDETYLNKAKQIIDRSRLMQKELFEPFLIQAKEKYTEGDYNSSRDLCEEMLRQDPAYEEAKECSLKAKNQLNRLAKEAYTHGYILESMNRIEEAKQYWNRAKNYVRPGDSYYDKVMKKLDYYQ